MVMEAYCVKCKTKREMADPQPVFTATGTPATKGRCPVCGQSMEEELHRCGACLALHHEDCWTYFGGCAIYACSRAGGTRLPAKK